MLDVIVDIRLWSPTFGKWAGVRLSADNHRQLFAPPGFAHGYCVLSEAAVFSYKCSDYYSRSLRRVSSGRIRISGLSGRQKNLFCPTRTRHIQGWGIYRMHNWSLNRHLDPLAMLNFHALLIELVSEIFSPPVHFVHSRHREHQRFLRIKFSYTGTWEK